MMPGYIKSFGNVFTVELGQHRFLQATYSHFHLLIIILTQTPHTSTDAGKFSCSIVVGVSRTLVAGIKLIQ